MARRPYTIESTASCQPTSSRLLTRRPTWLVQTLLKVTKAKVWASIVEGKSCLARVRGSRTAERSSCGRKAQLSGRRRVEDVPVGEEFR